MNNIRPISDLRNNFTEISKAVHDAAQPVFLTKNGYGDMVVMSMESYEKMQLDNEIYYNTKEPLIKSFLPFFAALSVTDFRVLLKTAKR